MTKYRFGGTLMDDEWAEIMRWWGYEDNVCPKDIRDLCESAAGDEILLEVNSDGGDLMVGTEIYTILRGYAGRVCAHIQSRSASAATVAMMGADEITAEPVALVCVHNPTTYRRGEQKDMQGAADTLEACKDVILNAYMDRAKVSREELSALMDRDVFITADKAVEYGLVDRIGGESSADEEGLRIVAAAGGVHFPTEKMVSDWRKMKAAEETDETESQEKKRQLANAFLAKYRY
jgi:ATP-dependent protease ClpP protease subunit